MIDLARWYIGDIAKVSAHLVSFVGRVDAQGQRQEAANDSAILTLLFQSGAQAAIHLSSVVHIGDRGQEQPGDSQRRGRHARDPPDLREGRGLWRAPRRAALHAAARARLCLIQLRSPWPLCWHRSRSRRSARGCSSTSIIENRPIEPSFYDGLKSPGGDRRGVRVRTAAGGGSPGGGGGRGQGSGVRGQGRGSGSEVRGSGVGGDSPYDKMTDDNGPHNKYLLAPPLSSCLLVTHRRRRAGSVCAPWRSPASGSGPLASHRYC